MDIALLFLPLALLAGGLLTVQASANLQLRVATGSPLAAATLQLTVGTLVLLAVAGLGRALGSLVLVTGASWWHLLGGLGSALYITATILLFPRLGAVVSVGLFIVGQMIASLALDVLGLLGVPPRPMTMGDVAGLVAIVAGAWIIVRAQGVGAASRSTASANQVGWMLLALAGGAVLPVQGAVNALLRADLGAPLAAGVVSFVVATVAMVVVLAPAVALGSEPRPCPRTLVAVPWWGWLGGICGATYVTAVLTALPVVGAAVVVGLTIVGQQVVAVLFDRYGLMRLPRRPVAPIRLVGVGLLLVGVVLIQLA